MIRCLQCYVILKNGLAVPMISLLKGDRFSRFLYFFRPITLVGTVMENSAAKQCSWELLFMEHLQDRLIVYSLQSVFGKTIPDSFFFLGQKNPNSEHNLLSSLSWEQKLTKWTQYVAHSSQQQLVPATFAPISWIPLIFQGLYNLPPPPTLISHPSPFSLPLPSSPPPPLLSSQRGVPAEDHCLRLEGPLIAGVAARGGVDRINPTDSNIWFQLCLMTMLAFHMQPIRLDQIYSIDLDGRAARAQTTWTRVPKQYSTHYTNTQGM